MDEPSPSDVFEDDEFENDLDGVEAVSDDGVKARRLDADAILDTLVPSTVDWRATVGRHPVMSVVGVGVVGYLVGRTRGTTIMAGVSAALSTAMMRQLGDVFDGDFFDF